MIQSRTGFGKGIAELPKKKIIGEIKSLKSKQRDLSTRIPPLYREKEMEIRSEIAKRLERGKVDLTIRTESIGGDTPSQVNLNALQSYYEQINNAATTLGINAPADWFQILFRLPDTLQTEALELSDEETAALDRAVTLAIDQLVAFRTQEGRCLQDIFTQKITNIAALLKEVETYEQERIEKIKGRLIEGMTKIKEKN